MGVSGLVGAVSGVWAGVLKVSGVGLGDVWRTFFSILTVSRMGILSGGLLKVSRVVVGDVWCRF